MARLSDHRAEVQRAIADTSTGTATAVDRCINQTLEDIWARRDWSFLREYDERKTWASSALSVGQTVTVTQGSPTVTRSTGAWTKAYEGGWIAITPGGGTVATWYRIWEVTSATSIELEHAYHATTSATATAIVYQDRIPLPADCDRVLVSTVRGGSGALPFSPIDRAHLEVLYVTVPESGSTPDYWIDDFTTKKLLWNTGTINLTVNSRNVVDGTTPTDIGNALLQVYTAGDVLEGWPLRVLTAGNVHMNGVKNATSGTAFNMDQVFGGATASNLSYEIGPVGSRVIQLYPVPNAAFRFGFVYYKKPLKLVGDNDFPSFPSEFDYAIDAGATWRMLDRTAAEDADIAYARSKLGEYESAIVRLMGKDWPTKAAVRALESYGGLSRIARPPYMYRKQYDPVSAAP